MPLVDRDRDHPRLLFVLWIAFGARTRTRAGRRRDRLRARVGRARLRPAVRPLGRRAPRRAAPRRSSSPRSEPRTRRGRTRRSAREVDVDDVSSTGTRPRVVVTRVDAAEGQRANDVLLEKRADGLDRRRVLAPHRRDRREPAARRAAHRRREPADGHRQGDARCRRRDARGACGACARRGVRPGDRGRSRRERAARGARRAAGRGPARRAARGRRRARHRRSGRGARVRPAVRRAAAARSCLAEWPGAGTVIPVVDGRLQYACARYGRPRSSTPALARRARRSALRIGDASTAASVVDEAGVARGRARRTRSPTSTRPKTGHVAIGP